MQTPAGPAVKLRAVKRIIAILGLSAMVCSLRAQTNTLSLAEARRLALERNWDLLAARSSV